MYQIHPNARPAPAVCVAIASSTEPLGVLAKRYGMSTETIRKWRRGRAGLPSDPGLDLLSGQNLARRLRPMKTL